MIKKRLSELSYNKDEFDRPKLLYVQTEVKTNKNRNQDIVWFNPSFSWNVKTNIGKTFLKLIQKAISKTSPSPQNFQSKYHQIKL